MRISDWSSDVCSSDLVALVGGIALGAALSARLSGSRRAVMSYAWSRGLGITSLSGRLPFAFAAGFIMLFGARVADGCTSGHGQIGRASCRERVCQYV